MKKKRILALLLVCVLALSLFSGCGRGTSGGDDSGSGTASVEPNKDDGDSDGDSSGSDGDSSGSDSNSGGSDSGSGSGNSDSGSSGKVEEGQELSAFIEAYTSAKTVVYDGLSKKIEEGTDPMLMMSMLGFAMVDLHVAFVPMFDVVDQTGVIPFMNLKNAYRKKSGDVISFGADFTRDEDGSSDSEKKDDRVFWDGKLDMKDESLSVFYYTERGGKKIEKTVMEITKNKDGSYTSQTLSYGEGEEGKGALSGYFIQFEDENMDLVSGNIAGAKPDFDYVTVFKKRNVDVRSLSKGFEITTDLSLKDGKVINGLAK